MVKDYKDYLQPLSEMYPDIPKEVLEKVIKKGLSGIQDLIRRDHDIRLENLNCKFDQYRVILFRSKHTEEDKKARYFQNKVRLSKLRQDKKDRYEKADKSK